MTVFTQQIRVDCAANPLNPMPVAQAVWREITRLRARDDKPILVLSGEVHDWPAVALLPYAFLRCSGLYNSTAPEALQTRFVYSHERDRNTASHFVDRDGVHHLPQCGYYSFFEKDAAGQRQLHTYLTAFTKDLPHSFHALASVVLKAGIKYIANDLPRGPSVVDLALFRLNQTDPEVGSYCQRVLGEDRHRLCGHDVRGMQIRNIATADKLRANLTEGAVVWHQSGLAHVYGHRDTYPYSQSLAGLFNRMAKRGDIHLLYVVPEHPVMPKQRYASAGLEICAENLSQLNPDEWAFRNRRPKDAMELQVLANIHGRSQAGSVWLQNLALTLTTVYREIKLNRVDIPRWIRADKKVAQNKHT